MLIMYHVVNAVCHKLCQILKNNSHLNLTISYEIGNIINLHVQIWKLMLNQGKQLSQGHTI